MYLFTNSPLFIRNKMLATITNTTNQVVHAGEAVMVPNGAMATTQSGRNVVIQNGQVVSYERQTETMESSSSSTSTPVIQPHVLLRNAAREAREFGRIYNIPNHLKYLGPSSHQKKGPTNEQVSDYLDSQNKEREFTKSIVKDRKCIVCNKPSDNMCTRCHSVYYCGKMHKKLDWKKHKRSCASLARAYDASVLC